MPCAQTWELVRMPWAHGWNLLRIHWHHTWAVVNMLCIIGRPLLENCYSDLISRLRPTFSNFPIRKTLKQTIKYEAKIMGTDTKRIKALMYFWLQKIKVKKSWESFQIQNERRQSWLQKWVSTVCDAILSSSLLSNQTGHFPKKNIYRPQRHWTLFQEQMSKFKSGWLEKASAANIKKNKNRDEAELHNTLTCQLRSRIPKYIWNHDQRRDWHIQKYYSRCQTKVCSKKSNWFKYQSQGLILEKLKCQTRLASLSHFSAPMFKSLAQ